MIELTPLDVRKKKGDFRRGLRGYEQAQVDDFLDVVADRMEILVREAAGVGDRIARLEQQVADYRDREKALTEALVTAQQMREDMRSQSRKEIEMLQRQAEQEAAQIRADAVKAREREEEAMRALRSRQLQFMASYRTYLEQEISDISAMARGIDMHAAGALSQPSPAAAPTPPAIVSPPVAAAPVPPALVSPPVAEPARPQPAPVTSGPAPAASAPAPAAEPSGLAAATTVAQVSSVAQAPASPAPVAHSSGATSTPPAPGKASSFSTGQTGTQDPAPAHEDLGGWSPDSYENEAAPARTATDQPAHDEADELDAQLEEALARWEPELEPDDDDAADESEQDDELILSDDDVINGSTPAVVAEAASADDDGIDDIMDFLDLEDEPVAEAAPSTNGRGHDMPAMEEPESDVSTAMGGPADDDDFAALAAILAEEEQPYGVDEVESSRQEATEESDAEATDDELVETGEMEGVAPEPSFAEAESEFPDDSEFFNGEGRDGDHRDGGEYADPFSSREDDSESSLIDLDSMGALTRYEPASGGSPDTSTLTLHPMFFDQDSPDLPGMLESNGTEKDPDRWS
jgi:cell division initiation protein